MADTNSPKQSLDDRYNDCLDKMYALGRFGIVLGLDTIRNILANLDNPHQQVKTIHIAGTNGKGSVASSLSAILCQAGYKTGLYTSPHLVSFNERICINGKPITNQEVIDAFDAVQKADNGERGATFFEINTAMAFHAFAIHGCEFAIIETGMGGRLDATNIICPELSVITNISMEHTAYLGDTLEKITAEKAGIIKQNTPVISGVIQPEARALIAEQANKNNADLYQQNDHFFAIKDQTGHTFSYSGITTVFQGLQTSLEGDHQLDNASLAIAGCEILTRNNIAQINEQHISTGLGSVKWPGRIEKVATDPITIIDGAHNMAAITTLTNYLRSHYPGKNITMIIGILDDKSYDEMLRELLDVCSEVIFTRADSDRSIDPLKLLDIAVAIGKKATIISSVKVAVLHARKNTRIHDVIVIAGSLYVAGEAKAYFNSLQIQPN